MPDDLSKAVAAVEGEHLAEYVSHKRVRAARIVGVTLLPAPALTIQKADGSHRAMPVDPKLFARYTPSLGDYFVVYDDGYTSISPKKAFEEGYTVSVPADDPRANNSAGSRS